MSIVPEKQDMDYAAWVVRQLSCCCFFFNLSVQAWRRTLRGNRRLVIVQFVQVHQLCCWAPKTKVSVKLMCLYQSHMQNTDLLTPHPSLPVSAVFTRLYVRVALPRAFMRVAKLHVGCWDSRAMPSGARASIPTVLSIVARSNWI